MSEHRTKTYLFRSLRDWATRLCANSEVDALRGIAINYRSDGPNWVQISIADPPGSPPRYFTIKITEHLT